MIKLLCALWICFLAVGFYGSTRNASQRDVIRAGVFYGLLASAATLTSRSISKNP